MKNKRKTKCFYDDEGDINVIFCSSKKVFKIPANAYYDTYSRKFRWFVDGSLLQIGKILPIGVINSMKFDKYTYRYIDGLRFDYNEMTKISQIDCITVKMYSNDYAMYLIWHNTISNVN